MWRMARLSAAKDFTIGSRRDLDSSRERFGKSRGKLWVSLVFGLLL